MISTFAVPSFDRGHHDNDNNDRYGSSSIIYANVIFRGSRRPSSTWLLPLQDGDRTAPRKTASSSGVKLAGFQLRWFDKTPGAYRAGVAESKFEHKFAVGKSMTQLKCLFCTSTKQYKLQNGNLLTEDQNVQIRVHGRTACDGYTTGRCKISGEKELAGKFNCVAILRMTRKNLLLVCSVQGDRWFLSDIPHDIPPLHHGKEHPPIVIATGGTVTSVTGSLLLISTCQEESYCEDSADSSHMNTIHNRRGKLEELSTTGMSYEG
uniref:Uncharacterized protein n=1 Tax=Branchiostoma floridae TaxID=7739 RepID=C3ZGZ8_BRAFL|eukprot:XP_002592134.1 hypothetical protein BRAFLDRAFT_85005 [Branchiostoma floridae]